MYMVYMCVCEWCVGCQRGTVGMWYTCMCVSGVEGVDGVCGRVFIVCMCGVCGVWE